MKASEIIVFIAAILQALEFVIFLAVIPIAVKEAIKSQGLIRSENKPKKKPYETPFVDFTDEDTAFLLEYTRRTQTLPTVGIERPNNIAD